MLNVIRLASILIAFSLVLAIPNFAMAAVEAPVGKGNNQELAMYYADQAKEFLAQAKFWENTAEAYEHHPELYADTDIAEEAEHCRKIARELRKSASEAQALASEHLSLSRKGQ